MSRKAAISRAPAKPVPGQKDGQEPDNTNTRGENGPGKPVGTPNQPSDLAGQAGGDAGAGGDTASGALNTQGVNDAGNTAEALLQAPGGPKGSAPGQGGEAEILPATNGTRAPRFDVAEALANNMAAEGDLGNGFSPAAGASAAGGQFAGDPIPVLRVVGPEKGRRRIGRRFGPEPVDVPLADLSEEDVEQLKGDRSLIVSAGFAELAPAGGD